MEKKKPVRQRIFEIIESAEDGDTVSAVYDAVMLACIVLSLITLTFKQSSTLLVIIDRVTCAAFIGDYILRWVTADYKFGKHSVKSFVLYPFTFMAIVDLISILPSVTMLSGTFKLFRIFRMLKVMRMMRALRVFRVFKAARYSKSVEIIANVFKEQKEALAAVGTLAILYVVISALIVFNVESDTFNTFFDAIYWACVSLTTVGYGDIYPVTIVGRLVAMISSIFGIAIVALPSGIITAGYMDQLKKGIEEKSEKDPN